MTTNEHRPWRGVLEELYASEIAFSVTADCWDSGTEWQLLENCTQISINQGHGRNAAIALTNLAYAAQSKYPESTFAKRWERWNE